MLISRPSSKYSTDFRRSVTWQTWAMNVQSLPQCQTDKHPFPDHLLTKTIMSTQRALSPRRPEQWTCSLLQWNWNTHFNTILASVNHQQLFKDYLLSRTLRTKKSLSSRRPKKWTCRVFPSVIDKCPFQDHLLTKTIISTWDLKNKHAESSPVSLTNTHFKTIFQVLYWLTDIFVLPNLNNECSLPQSHWPTNIFWVKLLCQLKEVCLTGDLNSEHTESYPVTLKTPISTSLPVSPINCLLKTIFCVELYQLKKLCLPGNL